jgi:hypothetical protein
MNIVTTKKLKAILCVLELGLEKIKIGNKYKGELQTCNGK